MPNKELFNQPIKTTLTDNDRLAVGIPGLTGAYNIEFATFRRNYFLPDIIRLQSIDNTSITLPGNSKVIAIDIKISSGLSVNYDITSDNNDLVVFGGSGAFGDVFSTNYNTILKSQAVLSFTATGGKIDVVIIIAKNYF